MPDINYRVALPDDVPEMADLFLTAVKDMYDRNSVSAALPPRQAVLLGYEHVRSTGIFRVAESEKRIVAIAGAVIRDNLWYLSAFWAVPHMQQKKIGMPLLKQVWEAGIEAGANIFFTWSSVDLTAMASYMKLGLMPGYEILMFEGVPKSLPSVPDGYETSSLDKEVAAELDSAMRGTKRETDHEFWSGHLSIPGQQVLLKGRIAGYYYLNRGVIGPAAWTEPSNAEAVLTFACREAVETGTSVRFAVPGINHSALRFAFGSGLRLTSHAHFLTTKSFGRMEQYLPSGPSLY